MEDQLYTQGFASRNILSLIYSFKTSQVNTSL